MGHLRGSDVLDQWTIVGEHEPEDGRTKVSLGTPTTGKNREGGKDTPGNSFLGTGVGERTHWRVADRVMTHSRVGAVSVGVNWIIQTRFRVPLDSADPTLFEKESTAPFPLRSTSLRPTGPTCIW